MRKFLFSFIFIGLIIGRVISMEIDLSPMSDEFHADVVVFPFWNEEGIAKPAFKEHDDYQQGFIRIVDLGDFKAKTNDLLLFYPKEGSFAKGSFERGLLLGLGESKDFTEEKLRRAVATAARALLGKKLKRVAFFLPSIRGIKEEKLVYLFSETLLMTDYDFDFYKSKPEAKAAHFEKVTLLTSAKAKDEVKKAQIVVDAINFARDLVNTNADQITPKRLAEAAFETLKLNGNLKVTVLSVDEIQKQGLGLLYAVGRASRHEPVLIIAEYLGDPSSRENTVIIGKGITYDTGGLSLKPTDGMMDMKCDMAGGAAVLGTIKAASALSLKVNLTAVVASAENAIGSNSFKLGDVYTSYSGQTVEVRNTDAEGRLVLADAISYAISNLKPTRIIDLATLTGACMVALGTERSGLFSNREDLKEELMQAGDAVGEKLWPFPTDEEYAEDLKSTIADLRNFNQRVGSLIFSGMFLKAFANETPWAHLDIAGTAYLDKPIFYHRSPATGFGIRLLLELVQKYHD